MLLLADRGVCAGGLQACAIPLISVRAKPAAHKTPQVHPHTHPATLAWVLKVLREKNFCERAATPNPGTMCALYLIARTAQAALRLCICRYKKPAHLYTLPKLPAPSSSPHSMVLPAAFAAACSAGLTWLLVSRQSLVVPAASGAIAVTPGGPLPGCRLALE